MSRASVDVHAFCRELRKRVMENVRKVYTAEQIKASWVWDTGGGRKSFEFHGPNKEYIYNLDADCKWSAEASGWSKLLAQKEHTIEHFYYQGGDVCLYCHCRKGGYKRLGSEGYRHEAVKHVAGEYVRGTAHTNGIESVWAVMKRGMHGVYHKASRKHMGRYLNEFTFRLNQGNVGRHTTERLDNFVDAVAGKRLTYEALTA